MHTDSAGSLMHVFFRSAALVLGLYVRCRRIEVRYTNTSIGHPWCLIQAANMQRRRRSRPMVAFCACADASLLPVSNEVLVRCGSEDEGVEFQLVEFPVAHNNHYGISQPIVHTNGNSLRAKQPSSEDAARLRLASSHRALQTLSPARAGRSLVRPSYR